MAAGLGFKDFVTGEVLTAADVDGYLMQGVWVFANAAARDAAVTSPQEGNFAYLKDTNVTTYYTGSAWANLDTTGMTNPMTTTGDTIYSSSGSTPARLGIGTTGQVLTVSGGIPSWATPAGGGGMTLLSTTTLSGTSTTISSISQSYKNLYIVGRGISQGGAASYYVRFNGNDTAADYSTYNMFGDVGSSPSVELYNNDNGDFGQSGTRSDWNGQTMFEMEIPRYTETEYKKITTQMRARINSSPDRNRAFYTQMAFNSTTAISSIKFVAGSGDHSGTIYIYGVN